jgi:hypothetical protein
VQVIHYAKITPDEITRLEQEVSGQQNLGDVIRWARSYPAGKFVPTVIASVIVQDEFTHDSVVPFRYGLVSVYDTTCLSGIMAVAVWTRNPTADEILGMRPASGWQLRPSILMGGDRVVGHAG